MQRRINLVEVITVRNTQEGLKKWTKKEVKTIKRWPYRIGGVYHMAAT